MYTASFGLRCLPFEDRADAAFFFASASHEEALSAMQYEIQHGTGVGLLLGETGAGKTILIRALTSQLSSTEKVVVLTIPSNGGMDILRETCKGFGVSLPATIQDARGLARLQRHLSKCAGRGHRCVLIIDQAENLSPGDLADVESLVELQGDSGRLLRVVLAGLPRLRGLLGQPAFSRLGQLAYNEHRLAALSAEEVGQYIRHRLTVAGSGEAAIFSEAAIDIVHGKSQGVPRVINQMCNAAMLAAYGEPSRQVTAHHLGEEESEASSRLSKSTITAFSELPDEAIPPGLVEREHVESTSDGLETTLAMQQLETVVGQARRVEADLRRRIPQASEVASHVETRTDAALREAQATLGAAETRLLAASRRAEQAIGKIERVEEIFERAESLEKRLTSFADQLTEQMNRMQARVSEIVGYAAPLDDARCKLEESIRQAKAAREGLGEFADAEIARLKEQHDSAAQTMRKSSAELVESALAQFKRTVESLGKDAETKAAKAQAAVRSAAQESQDAGQRMSLDAKATIEKAARAAAEQVSGYETKIARWEEGLSKAARSAAELISGHEAKVARWEEGLGKAAQSAAEQISRHEAKIAQWEENLDKAARTVAVAEQQAAQRCAELRQEMEQSQRETQNAHESWAGLRSLQSELTQAGSRLGAEIASARTLGDSLGAAMNLADAKLSQLASCQAAASHLHERMGRLLLSAHPVVERGDVVLGKLQEHVEVGEHVLADLGEANTRNTAEVEKAQEASSHAAAERGKLSEQTEKAMQASKQLVMGHEQAARDIASWQTCRAESVQLLPRLEKASVLAKAAAEAGEKLGALIPSGSGLVDRLSDLLDQAKSQQGALHEVVDAARSAAEEISVRTEAHLRESQDSIRQLEGELAQPRRQIAALETQIRHAGEQAAATQEIAAQLHSVVDKAQEQSENLERVCVAVRKVFAGLSQASLQARTQSSDLEESVQQANQTARSFQQWLERVRLQLAGISALATQASRSPALSAGQGGSVEKEAQVSLAEEPGAEPAHLVEGGLETDGTSRYSAPAREIAELIERARKAKSGEPEADYADVIA